MGGGTPRLVPSSGRVSHSPSVVVRGVPPHTPPHDVAVLWIEEEPFASHDVAVLWIEEEPFASHDVAVLWIEEEPFASQAVEGMVAC
jgi:hypothetical protein